MQKIIINCDEKGRRRTKIGAASLDQLMCVLYGSFLAKTELKAS